MLSGNPDASYIRLVVLSPPATEETGAKGRVIKSRQGYRVVAFYKMNTTSLLCFRFNPYTLAGFEPGSSVPQADAPA
jgi:hypothetical protein